jgi:hypothetical protein
MKSFKSYLTENDNPFVLGRVLQVKLPDDEFTALVVRVEQAAAALLVVSPEHNDCMTVISSKNLPIDVKYKIPNHRRMPIQSYFFQTASTDKVKRIEYHEPKKISEELCEDVERSALLYYQQKYRSLRHKDDDHSKLNLIIEILLTDADDHRSRFIA